MKKNKEFLQLIKKIVPKPMVTFREGRFEGGGRATSLECPLLNPFSKLGVYLFDHVLHAQCR